MLCGGTNEIAFFSSSVLPKHFIVKVLKCLVSTGPGYDHFTFLLGLQTSRRQLIAEVIELHSHDVELCVFAPGRSQILKGLLCKLRAEGSMSRRGQTDSHTPPAGRSSNQHTKNPTGEKQQTLQAQPRF